jgi:hypothetical protein
MRQSVVRILSFVVTVAFPLMLVSASEAQTTNFAQPLYGMWYTYPLGNPNTDSTRHEFRHNAATGKDEMIVTRLCAGKYRTVIARVVSPIEVSEDTIKVLKSATDSQSGELKSECQISVESAVLHFTVMQDEGHIRVTNPGGTPDQFELARQDATSEAALAPSIFGTWLFPLQQEHGASVQIKLVFYNSGDSDRGRIRQISTCSQANTTLRSQVDSVVKIGKDQITILESAAHDQRDGPFNCKATIAPGTLRYTVSPDGSTMKLFKPGEPPMTLTRDRSTGLN